MNKKPLGTTTYDKQYYLDHKEQMDNNSREYYKANRGRERQRRRDNYLKKKLEILSGAVKDSYYPNKEELRKMPLYEGSD